ncbi:MAG TPA: alpha-hydroxy acid oxidase [Ktedonobacteraceae bacterium]|nr:alpha-hydroxy acid oxidase [Ktedonobacteraceae bacterium]
MKLINVHDYEPAAQALIEPGAWDYYQGGSDDEVTLQANRSAFERIRLRPRMLVDVKHPDLRTTVLGTPISMPIMIAPSAYHGLAHTEGECATVRGAGMAGTLMTASSFSNRSLEEIAQAATGPLWFQLYIYRNMQIGEQTVRRAEAAGYKAIVLTADTPVLGNRERDLRNKFSLPADMRHGNFSDEHINDTHTSNDAEAPTSETDAQRLSNEDSEEDSYLLLPHTPTWETLDWLRSITSLPILLKGILTAEDAILALERGADGIIVSNHGGRQLDTALASIEALPEVVEAVDGRCEVYMDGGIRRGTDVLKALALGARAVLVGRPIIWGLAVDGAEGVRDVLDILRAELEMAMVLSGRANLASIDRSLVKIM